MRALPIWMWAVVIRSKRAEWIHTGTIARTRAGARKLYADSYTSEKWVRRDFRNGHAKLKRVLVSVE